MRYLRFELPLVLTGSTTLGRAWRSDATVLYKNCWMDNHISGWLTRGTESPDWVNLTFAEFNTTGPGRCTPTLDRHSPR
jgi:hypothetical protein